MGKSKEGVGSSAPPPGGHVSLCPHVAGPKLHLGPQEGQAGFPCVRDPSEALEAGRSVLIHASRPKEFGKVRAPGLL